jgi:hypothetical protein
MAVAMRLVLVENQRPTHWAVIPVDNGASFQLVSWPPQKEHVFATRAPFIQKMTNWLRCNFPNSAFGLNEVESDPTARPKGSRSGKV